MGNQTIMPFTEIFERAMKIVGEDSLNTEAKYKGFVNDIVTKQLPRYFDWECIKRSSYIAASARYNTGTVSVAAGTTSVTGVGTVWTSGMTAANGWKIKFNGNENIYDFTYASATTATISPSLSGSTNLSGASYELFRDTYSLASDFNRFLINGGLEYIKSGMPDIISSTSEDEWKNDFQTNSQDQPRRMRILGTEDSSGYKQVQINPPPKTALLLPYDYIKKILALTEYTTGTIYTLTNGAGTVTGAGTAFNSYITSGRTYYFRIDRDGVGDESVWYKVNAASNATTLTLYDNYAGTSIATGAEAYTISTVPEFSYEFHDIILYLTITLGVANQDNPMYEFYRKLSVGGLDELKAIYKTRTYNKTASVNIDRR